MKTGTRSFKKAILTFYLTTSLTLILEFLIHASQPLKHTHPKNLNLG